jgi:hypothetical protein
MPAAGNFAWAAKNIGDPSAAAPACTLFLCVISAPAQSVFTILIIQPFGIATWARAREHLALLRDPGGTYET